MRIMIPLDGSAMHGNQNACNRHELVTLIHSLSFMGDAYQPVRKSFFETTCNTAAVVCLLQLDALAVAQRLSVPVRRNSQKAPAAKPHFLKWISTHIVVPSQWISTPTAIVHLSLLPDTRWLWPEGSHHANTAATAVTEAKTK